MFVSSVIRTIPRSGVLKRVLERAIPSLTPRYLVQTPRVQQHTVPSGVKTSSTLHCREVKAEKRVVRFEPYDETRPEWIKDPTFPEGKRVTGVQAVNDVHQQLLEVSWEDGQVTKYPYLWMRDNCTCTECYHPHVVSRLFLMKDLDVDLTALDVKVDEEAREVHISWSDGHNAVYPFSWLEGRSFTEQSRQHRAKWLPRQHEYWGAEMLDKMATDTFENIMTDDRALYRWLDTLERTGFFLVRETPEGGGQVDLIGKRVAFLKQTHFGSIFEVKTLANPSNVHYTPSTLGMHTDLSYYNYTPGVQMLHCIAQTTSKGGDNQFCDGFHVAERLRLEQPDNFKLLTEVLIDQHDIGEETNTKQKFYKLSRRPIIGMNSDGMYQRITYNNHSRDSVLPVEVDKVNSVYRALKAFEDMLLDEKNQIEYKLKPGDIVCFHNFRVLHGRAGFKLQGERHLQGGYLDWDEVFSRRRHLQMMYDIDN